MKPFAPNLTWVHRINPSLKLVLSIVLFVLVLFIHNINVLIYLTFLSAFFVFCFSGHSYKRLLLLLIPMLLLFASSATSMIFFGKGDTVWLKWGLIQISFESFIRGLHIGLKTVNFGFIGLAFALTTAPVQLFYSLMQQLKLPPKYAYSFMAAMRLIPIMVDEFRTLRAALKVRGVSHGRGVTGVYVKLKLYSVPLLAQSIRRAQRIAVAMESKRFRSSVKRTFYYEISFSTNDGWFVLYWGAAFLLAVYAAQYFPLVPVVDVRYIQL
jgi:energy-coupling factor transport system permease protein